MLPNVNNRMFVKYERQKGHVYIDIPIIFEGSTKEDIINFVYDTGAYITVINRERYLKYSLDKLPRYETNIGGYSGLTPGYIFQIPGLIIGQRLLKGVWAFSPKGEDEQQNLLGDNVIEYFIPIQDNHNDCFYFPDNPTPEPFVDTETLFSLACNGVFYVDDNELQNTIGWEK